MYKNEQKNDENFWISYADLMAGLLFVFILVLGAIVIKYIYTQSNLEKEKYALNQSQEELTNKNEVLDKLNTLIKKLEDEKTELSTQLSKSNETINLNNEELQKLKDVLLGYEAKDKEQTTELENRQNQITLKDNELTVLVNKLLEQEKAHQKTVEEFDITKAKIKSLTGIKLNVITKLKERLGKSINIDEKSGAIKFSSNILFDQGAYKLKEDSKKELDGILKKYISTLLEDKEIRKYIYGITIEGHTNSDGTYLSNLQLSQQRALEVMQFLHETSGIDKNLLNKYVSSSGKSSSELIYNKDGSEDKDNSRRIEIKFIIKNDEAVKELQNYLGTKE